MSAQKEPIEESSFVDFVESQAQWLELDHYEVNNLGLNMLAELNKGFSIKELQKRMDTIEDKIGERRFAAQYFRAPAPPPQALNARAQMAYTGPFPPGLRPQVVLKKQTERRPRQVEFTKEELERFIKDSRRYQSPTGCKLYTGPPSPISAPPSPLISFQNNTRTQAQIQKDATTRRQLKPNQQKQQSMGARRQFGGTYNSGPPPVLGPKMRQLSGFYEALLDSMRDLSMTADTSQTRTPAASIQAQHNTSPDNDGNGGGLQARRRRREGTMGEYLVMTLPPPHLQPAIELVVNPLPDDEVSNLEKYRIQRENDGKELDEKLAKTGKGKEAEQTRAAGAGLSQSEGRGMGKTITYSQTAENLFLATIAKLESHPKTYDAYGTETLHPQYIASLFTPADILPPGMVKSISEVNFRDEEEEEEEEEEEGKVVLTPATPDEGNTLASAHSINSLDEIVITPALPSADGLFRFRRTPRTPTVERFEGESAVDYTRRILEKDREEWGRFVKGVCEQGDEGMQKGGWKGKGVMGEGEGEGRKRGGGIIIVCRGVEVCRKD